MRPVAPVWIGLMAIGLACSKQPSSSPTAPTPTPAAVIPAPAPSSVAAGPSPLGTATGLEVACPNGSPQGLSCVTVEINCQSAPAFAHLRVERPRGAARGTILLTADGDGTLYPRSRVHSPLAAGMIAQLVAGSFIVVEVAWRPGLWGGPRARTRACGFATVARWIFERLHQTGTVLVAQGNGTGASQVAFALLYYGIGDFLDLANLSGGPVGCPLCGNEAGPAESLLPEPGTTPTRPPTFHFGTTVQVVLGERETPQVTQEAMAFYDALTGAKSRVVVDSGHDVEQSPAGVAALVAAALASRR